MPRVVSLEFMTKSVLILILAAVTTLSGGCWNFAPITSAPKTTAGSLGFLSRHQMRKGSVALEIAVVAVPETMMGTFDSAWNSIDVQAIDIDTRQLLDRNGLRAGVTGTRLPQELATLMQWSEPISGEGSMPGGEHRSLVSFDRPEQFGNHQVQQLQPGTEHWIPCAPTFSRLAWSVEKEGKIKSGICTSANCGMTVGLISAADGTVRLWLRPEILHGVNKRRYGLGDGDFVFEESQDRQSITELGFSCRLVPGQTLIVAATPAGSSIGNSIFGAGPDEQTLRPRMLLIRPVNLRSDDLFETNGSTSRRLSTSLD